MSADIAPEFACHIMVERKTFTQLYSTGKGAIKQIIPAKYGSNLHRPRAVLTRQKATLTAAIRAALILRYTQYIAELETKRMLAAAAAQFERQPLRNTLSAASLRSHDAA